MTVTKDANKDYTRVAWTSPNTSGVIQSSYGFWTMTLCSNAYCLLQISSRSILCAGQPLRAPQQVPRSNTSWRSQIGTKWKTNSPTLVNSYGSAKHTVINANGQSVVYWTPLQASGTVEESLGKAGFGFFRRWASPWCIQSYSWFVVSKHKCRCSSSCIEHHSQANCQGCL